MENRSATPGGAMSDAQKNKLIVMAKEYGIQYSGYLSGTDDETNQEVQRNTQEARNRNVRKQDGGRRSHDTSVRSSASYTISKSIDNCSGYDNRRTTRDAQYNKMKVLADEYGVAYEPESPRKRRIQESQDHRTQDGGESSISDNPSLSEVQKQRLQQMAEEYSNAYPGYLHKTDSNPDSSEKSECSTFYKSNVNLPVQTASQIEIEKNISESERIRLKRRAEYYGKTYPSWSQDSDDPSIATSEVVQTVLMEFNKNGELVMKKENKKIVKAPSIIAPVKKSSYASVTEPNAVKCHDQNEYQNISSTKFNPDTHYQRHHYHHHNTYESDTDCTDDIDKQVHPLDRPKSNGRRRPASRSPKASPDNQDSFSYDDYYETCRSTVSISESCPRHPNQSYERREYSESHDRWKQDDGHRDSNDNASRFEPVKYKKIKVDEYDKHGSHYAPNETSGIKPKFNPSFEETHVKDTVAQMSLSHNSQKVGVRVDRMFGEPEQGFARYPRRDRIENYSVSGFFGRNVGHAQMLNFSPTYDSNRSEHFDVQEQKTDDWSRQDGGNRVLDQAKYADKAKYRKTHLWDPYLSEVQHGKSNLKLSKCEPKMNVSILKNERKKVLTEAQKNKLKCMGEEYFANYTQPKKVIRRDSSKLQDDTNNKENTTVSAKPEVEHPITKPVNAKPVNGNPECKLTEAQKNKLRCMGEEYNTFGNSSPANTKVPECVAKSSDDNRNTHKTPSVTKPNLTDAQKNKMKCLNEEFGEQYYSCSDNSDTQLHANYEKVEKTHQPQASGTKLPNSGRNLQNPDSYLTEAQKIKLKVMREEYGESHANAMKAKMLSNSTINQPQQNEPKPGNVNVENNHTRVAQSHRNVSERCLPENQDSCNYAPRDRFEQNRSGRREKTNEVAKGAFPPYFKTESLYTPRASKSYSSSDSSPKGDTRNAEINLSLHQPGLKRIPYKNDVDIPFKVSMTLLRDTSEESDGTDRHVVQRKYAGARIRSPSSSRSSSPKAHNVACGRADRNDNVCHRVFSKQFSVNQNDECVQMPSNYNFHKTTDSCSNVVMAETQRIRMKAISEEYGDAIPKYKCNTKPDLDTDEDSDISTKTVMSAHHMHKQKITKNNQNQNGGDNVYVSRKHETQNFALTEAQRIKMKVLQEEYGATYGNNQQTMVLHNRNERIKANTTSGKKNDGNDLYRSSRISQNTMSGHDSVVKTYNYESTTSIQASNCKPPRNSNQPDKVLTEAQRNKLRTMAEEYEYPSKKYHGYNDQGAPTPRFATTEAEKNKLRVQAEEFGETKSKSKQAYPKESSKQNMNTLKSQQNDNKDYYYKPTRGDNTNNNTKDNTNKREAQAKQNSNQYQDGRSRIRANDAEGAAVAPQGEATQPKLTEAQKNKLKVMAEEYGLRYSF